MNTFLSLIGLVVSMLMLKFRGPLGDMIGEAGWMSKIGGVYNVIILVAIFLFFWSLAELTGTRDFFLGFLKYFIPGRPAPPANVF